MRQLLCALLALAAVAALAGGARLPETFKLCSRSAGDSAFQQCVQAAAEDAIHQLRNGAPSMGITSLDPLFIKRLDIGQDGGVVSVSLTFENIYMKGISNSTITSHHVDLENNKIGGDAYTPALVMEADYTVDGRVLLLPIRGKGKSVIVLRDLKSHVEHSGHLIEKHGKKYLNETLLTYTMEPKKMEMEFQNLFNGDEALGRSINQLLNDQWPELMADVKPGLEDALGQIFLTIARRIFIKNVKKTYACILCLNPGHLLTDNTKGFQTCTVRI